MIGDILFSRKSRTRRNDGAIVEGLENRLLLSAVPVRIPADVVGASFDGTIHLHLHAKRGVRVQSSSIPIALQLTSLSSGAASGTLSANGQSEVIFTGTAERRSFDGVFADGKVSGTLTPNGAIVHGTVREVWDGDIITGTYNASLPDANPPHSGKRTRAQTTSSTSSSSPSTTQADSTGAPLNSQPSASDVVITEPILLPSLGTSFTTADALNENTTAAGISSLLGTSIGVSTSTNSAMSTTTMPAISNFAFSPSSGIISISNTSDPFTPSSGLTPLNAPPTFTPSSGITLLSIPGLGT